MQVPIFKPISATDFQTDFQKKGGLIKISNITVTLTFKKYNFSRVKLVSKKGVAYTPTTWVGKTVCAIPVPITVTDRMIDSTYDETTETYKFTTHTDRIIQRKVTTGSNIGRLNLPIDLVGVDVIIIETPIYDDF